MGLSCVSVLEIGALLHDVGHFVNNKAHHRHGEYLVRNGANSRPARLAAGMVACLVRYHNAKSEPQLNHKPYASLRIRSRRQAPAMTALLRIAEKLESSHRQSVAGVDIEVDGRIGLFPNPCAQWSATECRGHRSQVGAL